MERAQLRFCLHPSMMSDASCTVLPTPPLSCCRFVEVSASTGQAVTSMFDALFAKSWEAVQAAAAAGK